MASTVIAPVGGLVTSRPVIIVILHLIGPLDPQAVGTSVGLGFFLAGLSGPLPEPGAGSVGSWGSSSSTRRSASACACCGRLNSPTSCARPSSAILRRTRSCG